MSDPTHVHVLYFAAARDVVRKGEEQIEIERQGTTVETFCTLLYARYPALAPYARALRVAVNGEYAKGDTALKPGDEVAVIPPVAGG